MLRDPWTAAAAAAPSLRSVAAGLALVAAGVGLYAAARETSAFALRGVVVEGASPRVARQVERALEPLVGRSLVQIGEDDVLGRVEALPEVATARYDRAFPHTLVVSVAEELPVAVLRTGARAWLLAADGRVLRRIARGTSRHLPRIWAPARTNATLGERVGDADVVEAVGAAAAARRALRARVTAARSDGGELALVLAGGRELRLGNALELELKLAVANAVLGRVPAVRNGGPSYVDVSVPERAVAGQTLKSQVEVDG